MMPCLSSPGDAAPSIVPLHPAPRAAQQQALHSILPPAFRAGTEQKSELPSYQNIQVQFLHCSLNSLLLKHFFLTVIKIEYKPYI